MPKKLKAKWKSKRKRWKVPKVFDLSPEMGEGGVSLISPNGLSSGRGRNALRPVAIATAVLVPLTFVLAPALFGRDYSWCTLVYVVVASFVIAALDFAAQGTARPALRFLLLLIAPALLVASICFLVALAYFWILSPEVALPMATSSWVVAIAAGFVLLAPILGNNSSKMAASPEAGLRTAATLLAVLTGILPFVLDGAARVTSHRPVDFSMVSECDTSRVPRPASLQYVFTNSETIDEDDVRWKTASVVAFLNGQALTPLEWPSILRDGEWMHRRYLIVTGSDVAVLPRSSAQQITDEYRNSVFRVLTLGRDDPVVWEGTVFLDDGDTCRNAE